MLAAKLCHGKQLSFGWEPADGGLIPDSLCGIKQFATNLRPREALRLPSRVAKNHSKNSRKLTALSDLDFAELFVRRELRVTTCNGGVLPQLRNGLPKLIVLSISYSQAPPQMRCPHSSRCSNLRIRRLCSAGAAVKGAALEYVYSKEAARSDPVSMAKIILPCQL